MTHQTGVPAASGSDLMQQPNQGSRGGAIADSAMDVFPLDGDADRTLEIALSFLEDFSEDFDDGAEPTASAGKSQKKPQRQRKKTSTYNPNRARDERRQEMRFLRIKVDALAAELEQLKTTGRCRAASAVQSIQAYTQRDAAAERNLPRGRQQTAWSCHSVWKELATRQYAERHKAELENLRLKMMLQKQLKFAAKLEKLLRNRPNEEPLRDPNVQFGQMHGLDEDMILDSLRAGLANAILEVDELFAANGLSSTEHPFQDAIIRHCGPRTVLEVVANKVVPFDLHMTANVVYDHFTRSVRGLPYRSYFNRPENPACVDDVVVERFGFELQAKRTKGDFRVLQVLRRFVQNDRVLIAWRCRIIPLQFSSHPTAGIDIDECGYVMVRRLATMPAGYSLIQSCYLMNHTTSDLSPAHTAVLRQITDFFLDSNVRDISLNFQAIENRLLHASLHRNQATITAV